MRFLADESCDYGVVRALRAAGHDVRALSEETNRSDDTEVMALAAGEKRLLLTEDKDFGWLAFVTRAATEGVVLIRFPADRRQSLAGEIEALVAQHGESLYGCFTVLQPGHARVSSKPGRSR